MAPDPLFDIDGNSIIVAGACGGLGREITKMLDRRGARLTIADRAADDLQELSDELSGTACVKSVDVTDEDSAVALVNAAAAAFGRVDA